jgi:hypothetical protein
VKTPYSSLVTSEGEAPSQHYGRAYAGIAPEPGGTRGYMRVFASAVESTVCLKSDQRLIRRRKGKHGTAFASTYAPLGADASTVLRGQKPPKTPKGSRGTDVP